MVRLINVLKIVIGSLLPILFLGELIAQSNTNNVYSKLDEYRNWGVQIGPSLYNKASSTLEYGKYSIKNHPIPNYNFGLNYHFPLYNKWSIISGLWITEEPMCHFSYNIDLKDLPVPYLSATSLSAKGYGISDFSFPLTLNKDWHWKKRTFINFQLGIKAMYFEHIYNKVTIVVGKVPILFIESLSSQNPFYLSSIIGGGLSFCYNNFLLNSTLYYVYNFKNIREGYYKIYNLSESPDSYGKYTLSGSYLNLQFSIRWRKSKKKLREMEGLNNFVKEGSLPKSNLFNKKKDWVHEKTSLPRENEDVYRNLHPYARYQNLGIYFSVDSYERAKSFEEYGTVKWTHRKTTTFSYGVNYLFFHKNRWSFNTGLWVKKEASLNVFYFLSKKDLFPNSLYDNWTYFTQDMGYSFAVPFLSTYSLPINRTVFVDFIGGIKAMYYPKISFEYYDIVGDEYTYQTKKIMEGNIKTQDRSIYGSLIIGSGVSFAFKKILVQSRISYIYNLGNTVSGEYKFINLLQSPDSGGKFHLSGNHLSLQFIFHFKKSKKRLDALIKEKNS